MTVNTVKIGSTLLFLIICFAQLPAVAQNTFEEYRAQKRAGIKDPVFTKDRLEEVENDIECW